MLPYPWRNRRSLVHDVKSPLQSAREVNDAGTAVLPVGQVTTLLGGENLVGSDPSERDERVYELFHYGFVPDLPGGVVSCPSFITRLVGPGGNDRGTVVGGHLLVGGVDVRFVTMCFGDA